jgi:tetratricopeptide (TPR) repeat protein
MPIFGDYETIGEPLAVINLRGHASTVWRVRKTGAPEGVEWVVKCYVPHRKPGQVGDEGSLHHDRGLEFLEGVKQVKKVHSGGESRYLTPIHDLGISPDGVWYITDYYPRGSLQALIGRRAKVDDAALKQIVRCIVAGCLALKRSRGFSHGNLKASNVFLVGKPQPLSKTPMALGDAYPASALQMARLDAEDRQEVDELLHQVMEVQDLHSLGEIILQLVERRQIRSGYDYNYPIARSDFWDSLGKEGESWRQFCNQLLDPQLSLAGTNFDALAKKFPPPATGNKLLVITAVALGLCLVVGGVYGFTVWNTKHHRQNFNDCMHAAQQALQNGDFPDAKQKITDALRWEPQDAAALNLSQDIGNRIEKEYALLVVSADEKFKAANWDQALVELNKAFSLKPDGVEARDLKEKIEQAQQSQARQQTQEQQFQAALENGKARLAAGDYAGAMAQADAALKLKPNDAGVMQFKTEVRTQRDAAESAQQQQHELVADLESGRTRLAAGDFAGAMAQADAALNLKPDDETALRFKQSVRAQWDAAYAAQQQSKYAAVLEKGKTLLAGGDYEGAMAQADAALKLKPNDAATLAFKQSVRAQWDAAKAAQQQQSQYAAALQKGKTLLAAGDFAAAMTQADAALTLKPDDETAMQFKKDVRAQWDAAYEAQQQQSKYTAAVQKGKSLLATGDYAGAMAQAEVALNLKPNDATALQFKQSVQTQWDAAKAAQQQRSQYAAALENGRARLATGDYAGAMTQANTALNLKPNDATALQFKQRVQTEWDSAKAAQEQQSKYAAALQNGNTLLAAGDYAGALTQADAALAMNVADTSGAQKLKSQATEKVDFKNATDDFNQGKYDEALAVCSRHPGVAHFDDLGRIIVAEKGDFDSARASFEQGDYSFIEKVAKYQGKSPFADLVNQARPQADTFQKLQGLTKNSANWASVKNTLNDPSNASFINKPGFIPFRTWVQQHDPAVALNSQLSLFEVWFGVKNPDKGIIDPSTRQPAAKFPPGVVPEDYYTLLESLATRYSNLGGDQSASLNAIKEVRHAMDNWSN